MRHQTILLTFGCCACVVTQASAQSAAEPTAQVIVDGVPYVIPVRPAGDGKAGVYTFDGASVGGAEQGFLIQFFEQGNIMNSDPFITYGLAVTDFGAPSSFGFLFGTPIVPTGPGTVVSSSLAGSLTDGGTDNVTITPTSGTLQNSSVGMPLTSMGVGIGAGETGIAGGSDVYGPYSAGPVSGPTGPWTFLTVDVSFGLSGGGDIATLSGRASVDTAERVPETLPAWAAMGALGFVLLLGRRQLRLAR